MPNRKKIIVSEIEYWRKSKLLPSQYCDFLLQVYTEGAHEADKSLNVRTIGSVLKITAFLLGTLLLISLVCVAALYFIGFSNQMQIFLLLISSLLFYLIGIFLYWRTVEQAHLLLSFSCLLLLLTFSYYTYLWEVIMNWYMVGLLNGICLFWLLTGYMFRIHYLKWVSLGGISIILVWSMISIVI